MIRTTFLLGILILLSAFSNLEFNHKNEAFVRLMKDKKILVVAPGSGTSGELLSKLKKINSLKLCIPNNCFNSNKSILHSADDRTRYKCLENALLSAEESIVWALRGGYGAAKLIPQLRLLQKPSKEKIFIGYSDMTVLHIFLTQEWGWKTIHGSNIVEIVDQEKSRNNFTAIAEIITKNKKHSTIKGLQALNHLAKSGKIVTGSITGGNLSIIQTSIGTDWQIKTANKILFIEDVGITAYQLDRSLYHLKQAGLLKNIKAIIFGTCGHDDKNITNVLTNFAAILPVPVFKTNRFGHERINEPIIYNTSTKITPSGHDQFELIMKLTL
jgi:muramoyltetrapeptide carboxypeptidase